MDIQQPNVYHPGMGGGGSAAVNARFMQDAYRALKTPNFAVSKTSSQSCAATSWTTLTWPNVLRNNLNCFDTVNDRASPMGVPGMYYMDATVVIDFTGFAPAAGEQITLAIWSPSMIRAAVTWEIITAAVNRPVFLTVSCLDYLSGLRGAGEDDYRYVSIYNGSTRSLTVYGSNDDDIFTPRFQGFKIPY